MYDPLYGEFVEHVKTGDEVWYAGDCWEWPTKVTVGRSRTADDYDWIKDDPCYEAVNAFWNRLYFDNKKAASTRNFQARAEYGNWQIYGDAYSNECLEDL